MGTLASSFRAKLLQQVDHKTRINKWKVELQACCLGVIFYLFILWLSSLLWDLFHLQFGILGLGAFSFELALD